MAQLLRGLAGLSEDPTSIPSTYKVAFTTVTLLTDYPLLAFVNTMNSGGTQAYMYPYGKKNP